MNHPQAALTAVILFFGITLMLGLLSSLTIADPSVYWVFLIAAVAFALYMARETFASLQGPAPSRHRRRAY